MSLVRPYFLQSTFRERCIMCACVGANLLVVLLCATYLAINVTASGVSWPYVVAALAVGYFAADFASGLVHWGMDTWFDEASIGRAAAIAREHHTHPQNILGYGFLENATLGSAPSAIMFGTAYLVTVLFPVSTAAYVLMIIWFVCSLCLFFGTSFHNACHAPPRARLLRLLQKVHLTVSPEHHWVHHSGDQTIRYCVINGWANPICDRLHLWRKLEWLVRRMTGAVPRRHDDIWQRQYKATGTFPTAIAQTGTSPITAVRSIRRRLG
jgi:Lipid desaturase domain